MQARQTVAIIGGGASGLLTAIQILDQSGRNGPRIFLIEKQDTFGFGAAYATNDPEHLLNVRAGNMSAFPDKPHHFIEWLRSGGESTNRATPACFVSRQTYGRYLKAILRDAVTGAGAAGRFYVVPDEAESVRTLAHGRHSVRLAVGKDIEADCTVLALGNPPPHPPGVLGEDVFASPCYVGDPWSHDIAAADKDSTVLILGTGLTMADTVLSLAREGHKGPIFALSRRGLLPRRHAPAASSREAPPVPPLMSNVVADLRAIRGAIREQELRGGDWRAVIDSLRPLTASYWSSLPRREQERFLRHLRAWWEVHRHRLAPEAADKVEALVGVGRLKLLRGRLKSLALHTGKSQAVSVTWTPHASAQPERLSVSRVINCMGPGHDPRQSPFPLMRQMLAAGLIRPDVHGLGLATDSLGRVIGRHGQASRALFAIGPVTRGTFWEVTAIPDIRVKAAEVAQAVLQALQYRAHPSESALG